MKSVAKKKNTVAKVEYEYSTNPENMREFISETVKICVKDYNKRQENGELITILSREEIEDKSALGKISFGTIYSEKKGKEDKAIANALQCFEDGIVAIFIDGDRKENLDDKIELIEGSEITFVRLTMLSGRLW